MMMCGLNKFRDSPADKRWMPAAKVVEFCQNVVQALPPDCKCDLLQLPHFNEAVSRPCV